jgi:flagellar protein FlaG
VGTNISFGGASSNVSLPVDAIAKIRPVETQAFTNSDAAGKTAPDIKTVRDIKQAEQRGENVSISDQQLIKAIDHAIKSIQGATTFLEFSVHKRTNEIMVKVKDKETGELIREIPPEKTLDFVAKLWEMAGILVDKKG